MPKPVRLDPENLHDVLPAGGLTFVQGCSAHSDVLLQAAMRAGDALGPMEFTGIFVPGLNRATWLANPDCKVRSFFMTPELHEAVNAVTLLPLCYADVLAHLQTAHIQAALFMVAPPDDDGICSFGTVNDFLVELWPRIPIRIAHINPRMPRTHGQAGIPFKELTAFIEQDAALLGMPPPAADVVANAIGKHIAGFVGDHATLQTGIGKIPDAVLRSLISHRGLRLHSGLVGDGALVLLRSGAMAEGTCIVTGVAIGSPDLYSEAASDQFQFRPVSFTHAPAVLGAIDSLITLNSVFEVDLFGQGYAELAPAGLTSGPGGASDFARGARRAGGLRIVALPSDAAKGTISRIVAPNAGAGPISLSRMDIDVVVTEHGAADVRGLDHAQRAQRILAIAAPTHRDALAQAWYRYSARF